jgi:hypothetical protein
MSQRPSGLSTRDILTSTATLTGLALAALSFLANAGLRGTHVLGIASVILILGVLFFVSSVVFSLATEWFGGRFWKFATGAYLAGWALFGLLIVQLALQLGYQIDMFAIPNIPLSSDQISFLVSMILAFGTFVASVLVIYIKGGERLKKALRKALRGSPPTPPKPAIPNLRLAFLDDAISVEKQIRALASQASIPQAERRPLSQLLVEMQQKKIISEDVIPMINLVWRARNLVVHGALVPVDTLEYASWAASIVLEKFKQASTNPTQ